MAAEPVAPHRVHVISVRGSQGIPEPVVLELPQFQVHGMLCGEEWIDIASFTAVYRVTLDQNDRPLRYEVSGSLEGQPIPQPFILSQPQNLGALSGGAKAIESAKECEVSITSRIVETDRVGREIGQRIIFQGRGRRECGGGG